MKTENCVRRHGEEFHLLPRFFFYEDFFSLRIPFKDTRKLSKMSFQANESVNDVHAGERIVGGVNVFLPSATSSV